MTVSFESHKRLEHLESYIRKIHLSLPLDEARIQLLRCRLVAYGLVAEIDEPAYTRDYIDRVFRQIYKNISEHFGQEITDPYLDPCSSQYQILDELRSYLTRDREEHFVAFVRAEFKKVFVPTLRLMTDLCSRESKYSWQEVKSQLQEIMLEIKVDASWEECEERLERYLKKIEPIMA